MFILPMFYIRCLAEHSQFSHNVVHSWVQSAIVWYLSWFMPDSGSCSVQFSLSVMSGSLRPHESQHTRTPCPSPTPGVHSDSRPSSQWCHPAISSSVIPSSPAPNPSQHQSLFQWVNSSHKVIWNPMVSHVLKVRIDRYSASFFPKKSQGWISLQSKGLSRVFSNTTVQKHQFFSAQPSSQSNSHIHIWHWKNHRLD